jgi:hypothetical protein
MASDVSLNNQNPISFHQRFGSFDHTSNLFPIPLSTALISQIRHSSNFQSDNYDGNNPRIDFYSIPDSDRYNNNRNDYFY